MTTTASLEIESYYERVRAALAGLTPETRDDLLEDLPDHLAEVLAEGDGSLQDRLGEPEAYAAELRAAAGVEPTSTPGPHGVHEALECGLRRTAELSRRFDVQAGRLVGYPRFVDVLRSLAPGWWVLRGWIVAQFICGAQDGSSAHGFAPRLGYSLPAGVLITVAAVAASIWLGKRSTSFTAWPRRIVAAGSVVIAGWAVLVLTGNIGNTYSDGSSGYYAPPSGADVGNVSDVYIYDKDGHAVVGARLFDQDGNPIMIGNAYCADGNPATGAGPEGAAQEWTYPLCPTNLGPFRSGPGPLPATAAPTASPPASDSPAPTGSASSSPSGKAKPTAKASPTR
ncbi:MAG: hypothetical protein DLM58_17410 [Pseudonocardiales bacterium]|nr:MAG: hypothetical protein DLM58_17410 [Pseudonocardiales bacterium]